MTDSSVEAGSEDDSDMNRRLILLGPPGSGKGTVADRLHRQFGLDHISSGHLLRREVEAGSPIGKAAQPYLDNGDLVPDQTVWHLMHQRLNSQQVQAGFLLDGFPRNVDQARTLDQWLEQQRQPIDAALLFALDPHTVFDRMAGRRTCPKCGRVYHKSYLPPKIAGVCDDCGVDLIQREDDQEHVIRKRLETYARETEPVAGYYRELGKLGVVDADLPLEQRVAAAAAAAAK